MISCERLGLISLSYLWMKEQHQLFEDMCTCPINAILIKIASMGLKVNHLGKSIQEMKPYLTSLHHKFGFHVCGEGGEYETLTLDSPLFLKRIVLDKVDTVVECSDEFSPVAYLHINEFHLEEKTEISPERQKMNELLTWKYQYGQQQQQQQNMQLMTEPPTKRLKTTHNASIAKQGNDG